MTGLPISSEERALPRANVLPGVREEVPEKVLPAPPDFALGWWARLGAWLNMLFVDFSIFRFFFNLRQEFASGAYRSSHPMPYQLRAGARAGIRTVLNLRGSSSRIGSNRLEWDTARRCGLKVVHLSMASRDAPSVAEILGLVEAFATLEAPLWIHCKSGADRAGFAAAIYQLVQIGRPVAVARRELRFWWHGHLRQSRTGILDRVFDLYDEAHARDGIGFVDWVRTHYDRDGVRQSFRDRRRWP
ncbi:MAG TPA: sulfur transferase domain-containing protein [Nevskiaceae bacterium]|nr:sulfur transferase domain-containing protein [Nevskiaceae bacterium]